MFLFGEIKNVYKKKKNDSHYNNINKYGGGRSVITIRCLNVLLLLQHYNAHMYLIYAAVAKLNLALKFLSQKETDKRLSKDTKTTSNPTHPSLRKSQIYSI